MVSPTPNEITYDKSQIDPYVRRQNAKLTQVIQNFFTKAVQIVSQSRLLPGGSEPVDNTGKINKWFNLQIHNSDLVKDDLKLWKLCADLSNIPPMIIETYLDLRQLTPRQIAVLNDDNGNPWTVAKGGSKKQEVVLERWLIEFDPNDVSGSIIDELPLIYKQAIILFRSLYGFSRLMPAFKLRKALKNSKSSKLVLGNKVLDGKQPISSKGRFGLSKSIIPHQMLLTESHLNQKYFQPIQTTLGTLKVSIAYRRHSDFCVHESEEILSTQFMSMDIDKNSESEVIQKHLLDTDERLSDPNIKANRRISLSSQASMSVSPNSNYHIARESSPPSKRTSNTPPVVQRPSIQPFKIGSMSNSPPPASNTPYVGSSLERRISITSNKSASNASLAAVLRNPRSSTSSTNTTTNIPIASNTNNQYNTSMPRSISSSHGSNLQHEDNFFANAESTSYTPRFSSSFGSRASRRFSNTSIRQSTPTGNLNDASILGTNSALGSPADPVSGLYIDDDISDFVKMIDSKSDLRFSSYNSGNESKLSYNQGSNSQLDALSKFQHLKSQHQQLGDSVNASLILQHNQAIGSRPSSRKSSNSVSSPPPSIPSGSYDNHHLPSINSRLRESTPGSEGGSRRSPSFENRSLVLPKKPGYIYSSEVGPSTTSVAGNLLKGHASNKLITAPTTEVSKHVDPVPSSIRTSQKSPSGTEAAQNSRRSIHYENVFDDDDDDGEDYFLSKDPSKGRTSVQPSTSISRKKLSSGNSDDNDDDDDLLFTMSDMHITKH
ncbi:uncharacterized protein PRCAT00002201001 [Priceomyces carsonii]|uniref:uncharacterized protein n=1 Tax=Priceomyces carsonii TaxID=28549 RepID=UPI002ED98971|nr:unnamed protein product [Priceomyces carsonii]